MWFEVTFGSLGFFLFSILKIYIIFSVFSRYVNNIQQAHIQVTTTNGQRPDERTTRINLEPARVLQNRVLQERVVAMQQTTIHHTPLIIPTHIPIQHERVQDKTTTTTTLQNAIVTSGVVW